MKDICQGIITAVSGSSPELRHMMTSEGSKRKLKSRTVFNLEIRLLIFFITPHKINTDMLTRLKACFSLEHYKAAVSVMSHKSWEWVLTSLRAGYQRRSSRSFTWQTQPHADIINIYEMLSSTDSLLLDAFDRLWQWWKHSTSRAQVFVFQMTLKVIMLLWYLATEVTSVAAFILSFFIFSTSYFLFWTVCF